MTEFIAIAAVSKNGVIGRDNDIPWDESADMKFFRETTMGEPVIMGRRTWESLPSGLDGRLTVVLSERTHNYGDVHATSIEEAKDVVANYDTAFVAGGEHVYRQMLNDCNRLVLTRIPEEFKGDAIFPEYPPEDFEWELYKEKTCQGLKFQEWR